MVEFLKAFWRNYGTSVIMMLVTGLAVAFVTELAVKKTFKWLEKKLGNKAWMPVAKCVAIQVFAIGQVVIYTKLLVSALPFPGGVVLYPIWLTLEYLIQYAWSLLGFGKFVEWIASVVKKRSEAKAIRKAEEEANKPVLTPIEGHKDIFKNVDGQIVDKNGRLI
jgi:hypothetical protein